jgi:hypothetical protein
MIILAVLKMTVRGIHFWVVIRYSYK